MRLVALTMFVLLFEELHLTPFNYLPGTVSLQKWVCHLQTRQYWIVVLCCLFVCCASSYQVLLHPDIFFKIELISSQMLGDAQLPWPDPCTGVVAECT